MFKKILCVCAIICCALFSLTAQQSQSGQSGQEERGRTIEELYLSQNIELQLIRNQASSNDWEVRSLAIQNLRNMATEGRISEENPGGLVILEEMAKPIEQGGNTRNFNTIRREACNILGDVGGKRSQRILLDVLNVDKEPMVLAEAVYALGKIGRDENGEVLVRLMSLLHTENVKLTPDNNFAYSVLLSISKIAKGQDGIKAPEALGPLLELLGSNYKKEVKKKALEVIYELQS
ncbi:MAG: HEAT repeat domain-containing protein [Spirochaetales bacterium]|jgi:HEAT repeat protein|nr:HEAT repeat domain-containing protein [Spirochaetales bacterium]